eukprot:TRINITY_DN57_c8_g1_i1.p1 TRINITY_DN57_c8_g1~~TRINITY_DN57_c8_g1_i1.p1  ORF type:complete len:296 (-),score=77.78 TRINITY_DN57_c8_g1_i1:318-1205(-)
MRSHTFLLFNSLIRFRKMSTSSISSSPASCQLSSASSSVSSSSSYADLIGTSQAARDYEKQIKPLQIWRTVEKKTIHKSGKWLTLESHKVELTDTKKTVIPEWAWINSMDFINVACVTKDHQWVVFNQTKYGVGVSLHSNTLAPVGGYLNEGENPLEAAKRELKEESGYVSNNWVKLHTGIPDANRGAGIGYLFLALDAEFAGKSESDDLEEQQTMLLSTDDIEHAVMLERFKVHSWSLTMAMSLLYYRKWMLQNNNKKDSLLSSSNSNSTSASSSSSHACTVTSSSSSSSKSSC